MLTAIDISSWICGDIEVIATASERRALYVRCSVVCSIAWFNVALLFLVSSVNKKVGKSDARGHSRSQVSNLLHRYIRTWSRNIPIEEKRRRTAGTAGTAGYGRSLDAKSLVGKQKQKNNTGFQCGPSPYSRLVLPQSNT
jgi:hypothetical protein